MESPIKLKLGQYWKKHIWGCKRLKIGLKVHISTEQSVTINIQPEQQMFGFDKRMVMCYNAPVKVETWIQLRIDGKTGKLLFTELFQSVWLSLCYGQAFGILFTLECTNLVEICF